MESQNFDILKNFGISGNLFKLNNENSNKTDVYIIKQEKIKKNFSDGAISIIPGSYLSLQVPKAKDDMELYQECDQEYAVFGGAVIQKEKMPEAQIGANRNLNAKSNFSFLFDNYNDFNLNNNFNLNAKKTNAIESNLSSCFNFSNNFGALKGDQNKGKEAQCPKSHSVQTFFANENCENKFNNFNNFKCVKINSIENACCEIKNKETNLIKNNLNHEAGAQKNFENKIIDDISADKNNNQTQTYSVSNNNINKDLINNNENDQPVNSEEELKNGIFKNSMQNQMDQLNRIFQEMNESSEAKVIIKAYKSKLKTKFYKIYESNSEFYKEKNKNKIFHKCNFPGCSRTFASAGWLRSHFNEHMPELKSNKFNAEFERSLRKLKHMNLLK